MQLAGFFVILTIMNEIYRDTIIKMAQVDQELRLSAKPGKGPLNYLIYVTDAIHRIRLIELIKKYGCPTKRLIGSDGMKKFWLLIQHQDMDIELQKECLKRCDFAPSEKAYLTDRVLMNSNKPQRYGTQFHIDVRGRHVPWPIENRSHVDKRRKDMGLSTLKTYTIQIHRAYRNRRKR